MAVTTPVWNVAGQYFETCSCDFVCPCILTQMTAKPSKGSCTFAMSFKIEKGKYESVTLDGLGFIVIGFTPAEMGKGNWTAGVIVDELATPEQRDAIVAIATGGAGGPMAALAGMITKFAGVESAPIRFERDGVKWSVNASSFVSMSASPAMGIDPMTTCPCSWGIPATRRTRRFRWPAPFTARSARSACRGMTLTGRNNGQYAPFVWANS